ncbi:hypothetical protein NE236_42965 [Actinoallomurus purpureus]|uniref:hypothetical protein n=1 Tax=Actinoallomurus purpureus TaxID=478114 RepID=UPI0020928865|nr:hypothetical protein [Actinoallomurus purpureus]MCO6011729.1 hypothetical protein [Actinoallomurus purpureus]
MSDMAVLGVDPGRRWTAGVVRVGAVAVHGWTIGPVDEQGRPSPAAADNVHDLRAWARYMARLIDTIDATIEQHQAAGGGRVYLACEVVLPPGGGRIALADWLVPRQIVAGLLGYDAGLVLVRPDAHGKAHYDRDERNRLVRARPVTENYPPELWPTKGHTGGRPASWGPNEARKGERDHERAAYDIAGVAAAELLARGNAA